MGTHPIFESDFDCLTDMPLFGSSNSFSSTVGSSNTNQEHSIADVPTDTVSRLRFSNASNQSQYICASSWVNDVRIWQVATQNSNTGSFSSSNNVQIATQAKAMKNHEGPVLDCCWSEDNSKVFSVGADKKGMLWDLGSDTFNQVASHDQPITCCSYAKGTGYECVVTGSLDKTLKLWDMRQ